MNALRPARIPGGRRRWRLAAASMIAPSLAATQVAGAVRASAATLNVCPRGCPFTQLAPAIAAARDGDTIAIGRGTYRGGIVINVSVKLVGEGPGSTVIRGGDSVVTIGTFHGTSEPTVSITGVTITGGVARSSPRAVFIGIDGVEALGGGIEIPEGPTGGKLGATVTITDSVITGNRVAPTRTVSSPGGVVCPSGSPCPYAWAAGGGIDSWGTLTLNRTTVSDNLVGSASGLSGLASDVEGGGIMSHRGPLIIRDSVISGNRAGATGPNGRFADTGGVFVARGQLTMVDTSVRGNSATLDASLPRSVDMLAIAGGVHVGSGATGSIRGSNISGNSVSMTNTVGDAAAWSGGVHSDGDVELRDVVIADNSVISRSSSGNAIGDSGAGEVSGVITDTRLVGNTVSVTASQGDATASAGASIVAGSMRGSVVTGNHARASSAKGTALVAGGGLALGGPLSLGDTVVSGNTGEALGLAGSAQGGGVYTASQANGAPGGPLTLIDSAVTRNSVSGSAAITVQGGGVFAGFPVTSTDSLIARNSPDQCHGC